jgi:hypothetical protein
MWLVCLLLLTDQIKSQNPDSLLISIEKAAAAKDKIPALILLSQTQTGSLP